MASLRGRVSADRLPLVIGEDRMIPGWEDHLVGMEIGESKGFDSHLPRRLPRRGPARQGGPLRRRGARPAREAPPRARPTSSRRASPTSRPSTPCAPRSATRMEQRADAEARHAFGDRIIDFADDQRDGRAPRGDGRERGRDHARRAAARGWRSSASGSTSTWPWRSRRPRSSPPSCVSRRRVG